MRKDAALQAYFENFMMQQFPGVPVPGDEYYLTYSTTNVPNDTFFPYLTYEYIDSDWEEGEVGITVNIWDRTESEAGLNKAASELKEYIRENEWIKCEEGYIWVKVGSPWSTPLKDETEKNVRGRYINVTLEYLTR